MRPPPCRPSDWDESLDRVQTGEVGVRPEKKEVRSRVVTRVRKTWIARETERECRRGEVQV